MPWLHAVTIGREVKNLCQLGMSQGWLAGDFGAAMQDAHASMGVSQWVTKPSIHEIQVTHRACAVTDSGLAAPAATGAALSSAAIPPSLL